MLLNREALLVLDTADTSLTSLSDDLADRLSEPRGSLPERCGEDKKKIIIMITCNTNYFLLLDWNPSSFQMFIGYSYKGGTLRD